MAGITEALRRFGGMYGSAWRDNVQLSEAVTVTGNVAINRIEVPLVGQTKTGYKPGRETREGTLTIQKIDARWELEIFKFLNASLAARRAARGTPQATLRTFDIKIELDDPEAGYEAWQLENVRSGRCRWASRSPTTSSAASSRSLGSRSGRCRRSSTTRRASPFRTRRSS
jgi:hypothetical protein